MPLSGDICIVLDSETFSHYSESPIYVSGYIELTGNSSNSGSLVW